jgi:hypothetical protein
MPRKSFSRAHANCGEAPISFPTHPIGPILPVLPIRYDRFLALLSKKLSEWFDLV